MNPERTLLRCGLLVADASEDVLRDAAVLIEDGRVQSVGDYGALRRTYPLAPERGGADLAVLPGFVDAHSHGRGMELSAQGVVDAPLEPWLARLTVCTRLDPRDDSLVAATDLLAAGVTSVQVIFHSFSGPEDYARDLSATADGLEESGIRFDLVAGITDRHEFVPPVDAEPPNDTARSLAYPERGMDAEVFFEVFDALSETWARETPEDVRLVLGPVAPQWCSDAALRGVAERARGGTRVHTHLMERPGQRSPVFGEPPVPRLDGFGLLGDGLSVAHGIWLEPDEISLLAERAVAVVHCPGSNTRLGSGTAPVREMLDAGIPVALGLDSHPTGEPPDVFVEMRRALEMAADAGSPLTAREVFRMATLGGASSVGRQGEIGTVSPGARADLVVLDTTGSPPGVEDPVSSIVAHASREDVREVWVGGLPIVEEGTPVKVAEAYAARARLREALRRDAPRRERRLHDLESLESWLMEAWEMANAGGSPVRDA